MDARKGNIIVPRDRLRLVLASLSLSIIFAFWFLNFHISNSISFAIFIINQKEDGKGKADNMKLLALAVPPTQGSILLEAIS